MKGEIISIALVSVFLLICGCISTTTSEESFDKEGALEFSLKIVQTYFDNDMDVFVSYFADTVYTLEGDGPYSKEELDQNFATHDYVADEEYIDWTMDQYMETFDPEVLDNAQVENKYPGLIQGLKDLGWDYDDDDYMFQGFETKSGDDSPLWDDPLVFVVTHETGEWKFKAFSG